MVVWCSLILVNCSVLVWLFVMNMVCEVVICGVILVGSVLRYVLMIGFCNFDSGVCR